ncbi:hypothetical protein, partial [Streptomyces sp. NPDC059744]|uniref:hypothetical protein n=1 Tax=Streptomyces sp. NPDC059744 TaxID=3346929 RepID=UPI00365D6E3F
MDVEKRLRDENPGDDCGRGTAGVSRRRFLGYVVAGSTLTVAAQLGEAVLAPSRAAAVVPSVPGPSEVYDHYHILTHPP